MTAGAIDDGGGRLIIKVPGVLESVDDLINMPIKAQDGRSIRFGDVAVVRRTFQTGRRLVSSMVNRLLCLMCAKGLVNIIDVVSAAREVIDAAAPRISPDAKVTYLFDESTQVRNLLNDLGNNVGAAVIIVMIVILATLGLRNATLVGLAIPGSFFVGIIFLNALGITMNIVVLFSLILVAGMLVDGVIVTTEHADRRIAMGVSRRDAYKNGAQHTAWPIISSTITTLMVFMPLLFWPGIVGQFMQYLPMTVMAVLTASLAMALVFIPVLGGLIGKRRVDKGTISATAPRPYRHILKFAVRRPVSVLAAVLAFIGVSYSGYIMAGYGVASRY